MILKNAFLYINKAVFLGVNCGRIGKSYKDFWLYEPIFHFHLIRV